MRVVIADDAVLFREGLARVLADAGFDVAGQVGDGVGLVLPCGQARLRIEHGLVLELRLPLPAVDEL